MLLLEYLTIYIEIKTMKKILLTTILCAISSTSIAMELADEDYYAQINGTYAIPSAPGGSFSGPKFKKTMMIGIEGGLSLLDNARAGISVDFAPDLKYNGQANVNETGPYGGQYTNQSNTNLKVKSLVAMLNLYYDFDNFGRFSPYVMVGAGMSINKTNSSSYNGYSLATDPIVNGTTYNGVVVGTQTISGANKKNFAFKVGIGTRFTINNRFSIDLRYQYANLGKFRTGAAVTANTTVASTTGVIENSSPSTSTQTGAVTPLSGKIHVQELMTGIVYKF